LEPVTTAVRGHNSRILVPLRRASGTLWSEPCSSFTSDPARLPAPLHQALYLSILSPGTHTSSILPPTHRIFTGADLSSQPSAAAPLSCLLSLAASRTPQQKMTSSFRLLATANVRRDLQNYSVPRFGCCTASLRITPKPTHRVPFRAKFVSHFSLSFPSSEQTANGWHPPKKNSQPQETIKTKKKPAHKSTEIDPSLPDKIPAPHITPSQQNTRLKGTKSSPGKKTHTQQKQQKKLSSTTQQMLPTSSALHNIMKRNNSPPKIRLPERQTKTVPLRTGQTHEERTRGGRGKTKA